MNLNMHLRIGHLAFAIFLLGMEYSNADRPSFQQEVRPILSDHCFACHGPDAQQRQADFRLDQHDPESTVAESDLIQRIESSDPDSIMPPPDHGKPLTPSQIATLKAWVAAGAEYEKHWAFIPPTKASVPAERSAIDHFIDLQLKRNGLVANGPAEKHELLRRVCFDLTGLPPSRDQINRFLSNDSPLAYERLVDELLSSESFGQHVGRFWLDLVRYGDTHGMHLDNYREMWPYRDWVIDSINANMPFDQFVTEQIAGDLLPNATIKQKIASGFNRLNVTTNEGGSIYDEVFARNVMDRTDAFGTVFLGLTTGCAVCHDHKFDPITMKDYYSLYAFFNSLDGRAMDQNVKNPAPFIRVANQEQQKEIADFDEELKRHRDELNKPIPTVDAAQQQWEKSLQNDGEPTNATIIPTKVKSANNVASEIGEDGSVVVTGKPAAKDTMVIVGRIPKTTGWQTLHLQGLVDDPTQRVGLSKNGNVVVSEVTIETASDEKGTEWLPLKIHGAVADVEQSDGPFDIAKAIDGKVNKNEGWAVAGHQQTGPRNAWFVIPAIAAEIENEHAWIRVTLKYQSVFAAHQFRKIRLALSDSAPAIAQDQRVTIGELHSTGPLPIETPSLAYGRRFGSAGKKFDASEVFLYEEKKYRWESRKDLPIGYLNQLPTPKTIAGVTLLHQEIRSPKPQSITLLLGTDNGHVVYLNGKELGSKRTLDPLPLLGMSYDLNLKKGLNRLYIQIVNHDGDSKFSFAFRSPAVTLPDSILALASESDRSQEQSAALRQYYRKVICLHPDWLALQDYERGILSAKSKLENQLPTTLVWKELKKPREAKILLRGQYDQPGDTVSRQTPGFLPPMKSQFPDDRRGLAQWLTDQSNPLTARVAVNRFWQQFFGTGLVATSEDFGSQGEPASHPELLDWLAVDFQNSGWDVKRFMKKLVTSRAYRRSSRVVPQNHERDPENRFLARGPRFRLDAEMIRDQSLALSGLLNYKSGGRSIKPPQPDGLWAAVAYTRSDTNRFVADQGPDIYRRSVYVFWKRTSAPPQMTILDAPSREACTARRERTNTPLQALMLLNETQAFASAKALGSLVLNNQQVTDDGDRVQWMFTTVTAREPTEFESNELLSLLGEMRIHFRENPEACKQLDESGSADAVAWTILANTVLNLDEVLTK